MSKEILFVVDPMCSWCWGFAAVMEQLRQKHANEWKFSLVLGGLRTQGESQWDSSFKSYLKHTWQVVAAQTGAEFSYDLFGKEAFLYDTYPACRAVVSVRELYGLEVAFTYLHALQEAFYLYTEDITQLTVLRGICADLGLETTRFERFYASSRAQIMMQHDFAKARSMGATAFPSVVMIDEDGHMVCQKGYRGVEEIYQLMSDKGV